jgi:zinc/manganese transport system substrate-binding protein
VQDVLFASDHVNMIDPQPGAIGTPWAGDVHAEGNPHVHLDPRNLLLVANALAARLQVQIPTQKAAIEKRRVAFEVRWKSQLTQWQQRAIPLRGRQVAAQHTTFGYLWDWLGIKQTADLEPTPGMAPTPGHLQRLLSGLQAKPPMAVVVAGYQDSRPGKWLTGQLGSGVPLMVLPATVSEDADAEGLIRWVDNMLSSLLSVTLS